MKKAFTMVELIFVIVIIGVLSAVAIPKLGATRNDALVSAIVSNARTAYHDITAFYFAQGNAQWNSSFVQISTSALLHTDCSTPVDNSTPLSPNTFVFCNENVLCLSFQTTVDGNLTITDGTDTTNTVCLAVKNDPAIVAFSNKTYKLGGIEVKR